MKTQFDSDYSGEDGASLFFLLQVWHMFSISYPAESCGIKDTANMV